jgi:hypothetical protein
VDASQLTEGTAKLYIEVGEDYSKQNAGEIKGQCIINPCRGSIKADLTVLQARAQSESPITYNHGSS